MPTAKVFKDLNITFEQNPVTKDILVTKDYNAIKRAVMNLVIEWAMFLLGRDI